MTRVATPEHRHRWKIIALGVRQCQTKSCGETQKWSTRTPVDEHDWDALLNGFRGKDGRIVGRGYGNRK